MAGDNFPFWSIAAEEMLQRYGSSEKGLTDDEVALRLLKYGPNTIKTNRQPTTLLLLLGQFKSPITLILLAAAILSFFLQQRTDAAIILLIILISGLLSFWNERKSSVAVRKLLEIIQVKTSVIRNGLEKEISAEQVVPGDIVVLNAGDVIPGDSIILQEKDLFVNESSLTGESYPAEKNAGPVAADEPLNKRINSLFMGTYVYSGTALAMVVNTGKNTLFGEVSHSLKARPKETNFETGIRRFGYLLLEITLMLVIIIFAINVYFSRPVLDAFLFSLAIAVGLTPQLLPAIISVNLSHGARSMCRKKVIVRKLSAIENFGSMNVLCTDKTGTITEGIVTLYDFLDYEGKQNNKVLLYAYINAIFESGFVNPIDEAIRQTGKFDISEYKKTDEIPYDFTRKRLSVLSQKGNDTIMISKGAFDNILQVCTTIETAENTVIGLNDTLHKQLIQQFTQLSSRGFRVLGVAYKKINSVTIVKDDEQDMVFLGFLALEDPLKNDIPATIENLKQLGISLKILTGDNAVVAAGISRQLGIKDNRILTGAEIHKISNEALPGQVKEINVFAEIEPSQKERIIMALRKSGLVTGYLGDGINDALALQAADVSISVDSAAEVAKSVADIVLLEKDLDVLIEGVKEGRRTFVNTLKYIFMASSANFGNMFSMAGASLFLSFLPLLPKQILLMNLITDLPEIAIASDNTDADMVKYPQRWNIRYIRNFMIVFGLISSIFDYLTFAVLQYVLHAGQDEFRTGWFTESIVSAAMIVLVIRTRKPFFKSRPGKYLSAITFLVVILTICIPFTPLKSLFGFTTLPFAFYLPLLLIIFGYILTAEIAKYFFYRYSRTHKA